MKKKTYFYIKTITIIAFLSIALSMGGFVYYLLMKKKIIKIGILHSQTGAMAISEQPIIDATLLAVEEINKQGGLLGCNLEAVIADGQSSPPIFAQKAEELITQHEAKAIFGCWMSSARKAVNQVVKKHNNLLLYPVQYEGLEIESNTIYTGACPNQQLLPGISWAYQNLGTSFFLVGSAYEYPYAAHEIIKDHINYLGGTVVGEIFIPVGSDDVQTAIDLIQQKNPDVILNNINGITNIAFFKELREKGITSEKISTMSFSFSNTELLHFDATKMANDYAVWNYFQSIDTPENKAFIKKFRQRFTKDRVISDAMVAGYFGVHIWANAVKATHSAQPSIILPAIQDTGYCTPEGPVYIDKSNHHTWEIVRIGKIKKDGQFEIVWDSQRTVKPEPFMYSRSKEQWHKLSARIAQRITQKEQ